MVESRLIREHKRLSEEFGKTDHNTDEYIEYFKTIGLGYNDYVVRKDKKLSDICANDKTFESDFKEYLNAFDTETRHLLGVDKGNDEEKYLDISVSVWLGQWVSVWFGQCVGVWFGQWACIVTGKQIGRASCRERV